MGDGGVLVVVVIVVAVVIPLVALVLVARSTGLRGIKDAVHGTAVVRGFSDTGGTVSSPSTGAEAPVYLLDLLVSPPGGAPYPVSVRQPVPRIRLPFFVPGIVVPVDIHPTRAEVVKVAFGRFDGLGPSAAPAAGGPAVDGAPVPVTLHVGVGDHDPVTGADELYDKVRDGSLPTVKGSAAELLASGARGTAVVRRAMPLGMRCGDAFPGCPPEDADDPIWMLVMVVTVPGQDPFPAAVGHRVPAALVGRVQPGLRLAVAVDLADRSNRVAVDWDALAG